MICTISTKTTGLKESHEVIELNIKPLGLNEVSFKVRPDRLEFYEENVQKINNIGKEICLTFPTKEEAMKSIFANFRGITPIGHYVDFDVKMLRQTFGPEFVKELIGKRPIDTGIMTEKYNMSFLEKGKLKPFKSNALAKLVVDLKLTGTTKCEKVEQLYKKIKELTDGNTDTGN